MKLLPHYQNILLVNGLSSWSKLLSKVCLHYTFITLTKSLCTSTYSLRYLSLAPQNNNSSTKHPCHSLPIKKCNFSILKEFRWFTFHQCQMDKISITNLDLSTVIKRKKPNVQSRHRTRKIHCPYSQATCSLNRYKTQEVLKLIIIVQYIYSWSPQQVKAMNQKSQPGVVFLENYFAISRNQKGQQEIMLKVVQRKIRETFWSFHWSTLPLATLANKAW